MLISSNKRTKLLTLKVKILTMLPSDLKEFKISTSGLLIWFVCLRIYLFTWIKLYYCYNLFHVTRTIIRQLNWNLICFQLVWEIKTNWTIQTTLGLIKYEGQNWGGKIEGKNWGKKNWLYAPSIMSWRGVWLGFDQCQCEFPNMWALTEYFRSNV